MEEQKKGIVERALEDVWPTTTNRFVAFIDIMGFKDMIARTSHDKIYEMMKNIELTKTSVTNYNWADKELNLVKTTAYSDSIMVYSKDDSSDATYSFLCSVCSLSMDLLKDSIPHKGAIAFGKMTSDWESSIFFGQPLLDAYLLQEELYFYGIIIHGSAEEKIEFHKMKTIFLKNYLCPLKNSSSNHLVFDPPTVHGNKPEDELDRESLYNGIKKLRYITSGHLRKYIDNTEKYLKSMQAITIDKDKRNKKKVNFLENDVT
jgi:hypothetical protein